MSKISIIVIVCTLAITVAPALAWDGLEILEVEGGLQHHVFTSPSPIPGYCYWDYALATEPFSPVTNADGYGNMDCLHPWQISCDSDSMVFRAEWPLIDSTSVMGIEYIVDFSFSVDVSAQTQVVASREIVASDLDTDIHSLTIEYPDGSLAPVLPAGSGPDLFQLTLEPGIYQVTLRIQAYQHRTTGEVITPYNGQVVLVWQDPEVVAVETRSWGSVKACFVR